MQVRSVSVRGLRGIINLGVAAGMRRELLMDVGGVTDRELGDPDARVYVTAEVAVWQMMASHVSDPAVGVRGGASFRVSDAGLLGYVIRFAPTLNDALHALTRYIHIFSEAVDVRLTGGGTSLAVVANPSLGRAEPLAQSFRAASLLQALRECTGVAILPAEASFTYTQPSSTLAHREFFRCPLHFGAHIAGLVFRPADLALPTLKGDSTLAGYLGKYADQVLASMVRGESMRHKVRAAIWSQIARGTPSLQEVGAELRTPPRTLQRRLRAEGTSLSQELQEVRKTIAIAALKNHAVAIDDVAFLLGYTEPSTFYRSFKRWTGRTPQEFRRLAA